jgi:hypothetical protein
MREAIKHLGAIGAVRIIGDSPERPYGIIQAFVTDAGKMYYHQLVEESEKFEKLKSIDDFCSFIEETGFLRLGVDWSLATIALQIQEVATMKIAKHLNISLDKENVEPILNTKLNESEFGFNKRYEALSKKVKELRNVDLPRMTTGLRTVRVDILHRGYNPKKEEVDAIIEFTKGFLARLQTLY